MMRPPNVRTPDLFYDDAPGHWPTLTIRTERAARLIESLPGTREFYQGRTDVAFDSAASLHNAVIAAVSAGCSAERVR